MRTAVVIGGGSGIGAACALWLADHDYQVAIVGRRQANLDEIAAKHKNITGFAGDMSEEKSAEVCLAKIKAKFDQIDVLINAAGKFLEKRLSQTTFDEYIGMEQANDWPLYITNRFMARQIEQQNCGVIINISSRAGLPADALPGRTLYSKSKGGMAAFTDSLNKELVQYNGRAYVVSPGLVRDTAMGQTVLAQNPDAHGAGITAAEAAEKICSLIDSKRDEYWYYLEQDEFLPVY